MFLPKFTFFRFWHKKCYLSTSNVAFGFKQVAWIIGSDAHCNLDAVRDNITTKERNLEP